MKRETYEQRCWRDALAELHAAEAEMAASMSDAAWHRWMAARATVDAILAERAAETDVRARRAVG